MRTQFLLSALLPLASAHFKLLYPAARGFDEDILGQFPCGGQNTVSSNRTSFPITGAPVQLYMGHTEAKVQVLLALGNDPGVNYNITLLPTIQEQGPQDFCIGAGALDFSGLNITEGMNATLQVVTNGDPNGGLYNCADITFTTTELSTAEYSENCKNSSGVSVSAITGAEVNANSSSSDSSSTTSATAATTAATTATGTSTAAAGRATLAGYALGAIGLLAGVAAL